MKAPILRWQATAVPFRLQRDALKLGPMPRASLETFVDLGLTDRDIGNYFKVAHPVVAELRKCWCISQPNAEPPDGHPLNGGSVAARQYFSA
jgi:hypothetical protein